MKILKDQKCNIYREAENEDALIFYPALERAVDNEDLEKFKDLITSSQFPNLSISKKVKHAFHKAYYAGKEDMLDYLIYDYGISVADILDSISTLMYEKDLAKKIEIRDLARELPINTTKKKISKV
jgi:hypothetical protein